MSKVVFEAVAETVDERQGMGLCRCHRCKQVGRCTPTTDYFTFRGSKEIFCEPCFNDLIREESAAQGRPATTWNIGYATAHPGHTPHRKRCRLCAGGDHYMMTTPAPCDGLLKVTCDCCGTQNEVPVEPLGNPNQS